MGTGPAPSSVPAPPGPLAGAATPAPAAVLARLLGFLVLLALARQAMLACVSFGRIDPVDYLSSTAPIVDSQRWLGFDLLVLFTDLYLAPLALLACGLGVWPSLRRQGPGPFIRTGLARLGLPWLLGVLVFMPLAYYLSYRQAGGAASLLVYWRGVLADGLAGRAMPVGPLWFAGLLLVLYGLAALAFWWRPGRAPVAEEGRALAGGLSGIRLVLLLWVGSALVYLPMRMVFGYTLAFSFGPFTVPAGRSVSLVLYFFVGVWLGAAGVSLRLARQWGAWAQLAAAAYVLVLMLELLRLKGWSGAPPPAWHLAYGVAYDLACLLVGAAASLAWLAFFQRFAQRPGRGVLDTVASQACGMFLLHGAVGIVLQSTLLGWALPALAKVPLVWAATGVLSWGLSRAVGWGLRHQYPLA